MYKVPQDIEDELQQKYPNIEAKKFIHDLFDLILQKAFAGGSIAIRELGKFIAYKTFSNRVGREQARFKFRVALSLTNKLKNDSFILEHLPSVKPTPFTKKNEQVCKNKKMQKHINTRAKELAAKMGIQYSKEQIAKKELQKILDED